MAWTVEASPEGPIVTNINLSLTVSLDGFWLCIVPLDLNTLISWSDEEKVFSVALAKLFSAYITKC